MAGPSLVSVAKCPWPSVIWWTRAYWLTLTKVLQLLCGRCKLLKSKIQLKQRHLVLLLLRIMSADASAVHRPHMQKQSILKPVHVGGYLDNVERLDVYGPRSPACVTIGMLAHPYWSIILWVSLIVLPELTGEHWERQSVHSVDHCMYWNETVVLRASNCSDRTWDMPIYPRWLKREKYRFLWF